ncbi:nitrilase-related carbon-nitrogen hydrolase [Alicyclobacillus fastidiosus]|uniref:nitrilase-related carbon-nitrogen hydrolase n=1 Tax=Alicyclobacillus fastidiosus TaxID=392011 RepID=UPI0023E9143C|nr:nitrilase-related carbon-nitrogen hydrolase [Alicyclobacillus fastidiosus]GMA59824.1 hypothetical protein GCM10025859_02640 [Alicyclobacillus fastidiosus]
MSHVQTIAVAQISPKLGDVAANLTVHHRYIERAKEQGAQVVVFPELGLTGYLLQDLTLEVARRLDDPDIASIVEASSDIDIVFSFVEESSEHFFTSRVCTRHRVKWFTYTERLICQRTGCSTKGDMSLKAAEWNRSPRASRQRA